MRYKTFSIAIDSSNLIVCFRVRLLHFYGPFAEMLTEVRVNVT